MNFGGNQLNTTEESWGVLLMPAATPPECTGWLRALGRLGAHTKQCKEPKKECRKKTVSSRALKISARTRAWICPSEPLAASVSRTASLSSSRLLIMMITIPKIGPNRLCDSDQIISIIQISSSKWILAIILSNKTNTVWSCVSNKIF